MFQFTLCILKPDIVRIPHLFHVGRSALNTCLSLSLSFDQEVIDLILRHGFIFVKSERVHLTRQRAGEFYREHQGLSTNDSDRRTKE